MQGTALDKLGKHDEARRYYESALKIVPEEPSVLSNLGLSYMLTRELPNAEQALRRAYGNPRVRIFSPGGGVKLRNDGFGIH